MLGEPEERKEKSVIGGARVARANVKSFQKFIGASVAPLQTLNLPVFPPLIPAVVHVLAHAKVVAAIHVHFLAIPVLVHLVK